MKKIVFTSAILFTLFAAFRPADTPRAGNCMMAVTYSEMAQQCNK